MSRYNRCKECYNIKCMFVTGERDDFDSSKCADFKPQTNADRIRAMSDEELADWYFDKFFPCVPYCSMLQDGCPEHDDCKICLLEWLKQKSEGE